MRRMGWILFVGLFLFAAAEAPADEKSPDEDLKKITIRMTEYRFEPAEILLKVDEGVELTLINEGRVMHEFISEALQTLIVDVEINGIITGTLGVTELEIPPKGRVKLRFTPEKAGEFLIACRSKSPKNHFEEGMKGKFLIR